MASSLYLSVFLAVLSLAAAQSNLYRVCIPASQQSLCQSLDKDGSRVICESVDSRIDCALKLSRGTADIGVFSEEELVLLGQQLPSENRVVASIRNVAREDPYAFEAVAVVSSGHTGGFEGLRGGSYCHPGLDERDQRWSPRVLRTLERLTARTDRCPDASTNSRTAEELEVTALNDFFTSGCRPGSWSANTSVDATLKSNNPNLCSLCGPTPAQSTCSGYTLDMGVAVAGVSNDNRHVQALECLTRNNGSVAYVAWMYVRQYFTMRAADRATSYSLLCEDGTLRSLTAEALNNVTSPCSLVKQPWGAIVASSAQASSVLSELRTWWPNGLNPGGNTWQSILYDTLVGGTLLRADFQDGLPTPANYTAVRAVTDIDATSSCMPSLRWCTISSLENTKCLWVRRAAYSLGLEPSISCQQRTTVFQCLEDIRDSRADFISLDSTYGYVARQHYRLSPVKLHQNSRNSGNSLSRVAALVRESSAQSDVTRFENLRGKKACFPEFGGLAYVTFVRAAHERGIISPTECDYAQAVGEFFEGACAPGALDSQHALDNSISSYNATNLCTSCRATVAAANGSTFTCAWDYTNRYFGNNGSVACLADPTTDIAFLELQNIASHLSAQNLQASQFRVLCRNNTLAATTGVTVDENCLLALVVDGEVLTRRSDNNPQYNSLSSLLDLLDQTFGYNAAVANQLINLEIYSPFDGVSDLLFKDSAIGLTEPSESSSHEPARNYFELYRHLNACTGGAAGLASRSAIIPMVTLIISAIMSKWVI